MKYSARRRLNYAVKVLELGVRHSEFTGRVILTQQECWCCIPRLHMTWPIAVFLLAFKHKTHLPKHFSLKLSQSFQHQVKLKLLSHILIPQRTTDKPDCPRPVETIGTLPLLPAVPAQRSPHTACSWQHNLMQLGGAVVNANAPHCLSTKSASQCSASIADSFAKLAHRCNHCSLLALNTVSMCTKWSIVQLQVSSVSITKCNHCELAC